MVSKGKKHCEHWYFISVIILCCVFKNDGLHGEKNTKLFIRKGSFFGVVQSVKDAFVKEVVGCGVFPGRQVLEHSGKAVINNQSSPRDSCAIKNISYVEM